MAPSPSAALEALLFASGEPVSKKRITSLLGFSASQLDTVTGDLRNSLFNRGLALIETHEELDLRTTPDAAELIKKMREGELTKDLGKAGLEALAIIMYNGGATRSEIDWIRGVNSAQIVRSLMLRGLIERTEDEKDKRKFIYRTTTDALAHVGVQRVEDLPRYAELKKESELAAAAEPSNV